MVDDVRSFRDAVVGQLQTLTDLVATLNGRISDEAIKDEEQRDLEKRALQGILQYLKEVKR